MCLSGLARLDRTFFSPGRTFAKIGGTPFMIFPFKVINLKDEMQNTFLIYEVFCLCMTQLNNQMIYLGLDNLNIPFSAVFLVIFIF